MEHDGPSPDITTVPRWFSAALASSPDHLDVEVDGCAIHLRCWGDPAHPGLVFVHGGAAHSGWWDHVAPFFADRHRVVALDLSGHGDSGHREHYDMSVWATEVLAAAAAGGIGGPPVVVGHSMGGWAVAAAGVEHGDRLAGAVIIDSPLNDRPPEDGGPSRRLRPRRVHPTLEEGVARFTTLPRQEVLLPYIARHIAEQSLRQVEGGWSWKFDPRMFGQRRRMRELLPDMRCRAALLRSEFGLVPPAMAAEIEQLLPAGSPVIELPDAGHHPMLDQPLPLVAALRTLLTCWTPAAP